MNFKARLNRHQTMLPSSFRKSKIKRAMTVTVVNLSINNTGKQDQVQENPENKEAIPETPKQAKSPKKTKKVKKESISSGEMPSAQKKRQDAFERKNLELQRRREEK
jgi:hypothetical protein